MQEQREDTGKVKTLFDHLDVKTEKYDIVRTHRLPKARSRRDDATPPDITVKLHHYDTKNRIFYEAIKKWPTASIVYI